MERPFLTIGMPCWDDYHGVYFSIQALRLYHREWLPRIEILVVDNKPDSPSSAALKRFVATASLGCHSARYVEAPGPGGPALSKERVVQEAAGKYVLCMDSHVLLWPGAVKNLFGYYERNPETNDLLTGPLVYDNLSAISTHFVDFWRGEMWGIWGSAWKAPTGERFSVLDQDGMAHLVTLEENHKTLDSAHWLTPGLKWLGHEGPIIAAGATQLGFDDGDEFEVPGQGMGLFSCRKESWPGFNPHFRGFGGEEMYMHGKYRARGDKAICLGFLKWVHRFGHPDGVKYPLTRWNKVRNYVLGFQELGRDLKPVYDHFVGGGLMSASDWSYLLSDPVGNLRPAGHTPTPPTAPPTAATATPLTINELAATLSFDSAGRPTNKHVPVITALAAQCGHVTDISERRESAIALAAGNPRTLISYNTEWAHEQVRMAQGFMPSGTFSELIPVANPVAIGKTDLLVLGNTRTGEELLEDLRHYKNVVGRWIVRYDTNKYSAVGTDGKPGFIHSISAFLEDNPDWFVFSFTPIQGGLTVLGCQPQDRPKHQIMMGPPGFGPGTELKEMLATLGINPSATCDCRGKVAVMDIQGAEWCRANMQTVLGWLRDGQTRWGWKDKLAAAAHAVSSGLAFKLNPLDPFPGLVEEALRRADESADKREEERRARAREKAGAI